MKRWVTSGALALILSFVLGAGAVQAGHPAYYHGYGGCRPLPPPPPVCHSHHHHRGAYGNAYYGGGRATYYRPAAPVYVPYGGGYPRGPSIGFFFGF